MTHTPDDIAEKVLSALREHGGLDPHAFLSGSSPTGSPFVLIKPEDTGQMWAIRIEGPWDASSDQGIAESSVALGFAVPNPPTTIEEYSSASTPSPDQLRLIEAIDKKVGPEHQINGTWRAVILSTGPATYIKTPEEFEALRQAVTTIEIPADLPRWHPNEIGDWMTSVAEDETASVDDCRRAALAESYALGVDPDDVEEPATV
ncbi:hypothetical protein ACTU45_32205 [Streptomyces sp. 24-1644]|uniref:hypothetical protein n=1 Tax=Streptomyces sp. 24-1644 TaxID=3457315 RepID=UPI003FA7D9E3